MMRHNFQLASEVTLYYDWKISTCCNRCILVWLLVKCCNPQHHFCCIRPVYYKTFIPWIPMLYYILNINDITVIMRCHKTARLLLVALYKSLTRALLLNRWICHTQKYSNPWKWLKYCECLNEKLCTLWSDWRSFVYVQQYPIEK